MVIAFTIFISAINRETSYTNKRLGEHKSTMELHTTKDPNYCFIEWDIPSLESTEQIGIYLEDAVFEGSKYKKATLSDYDGVFSLPKEAIELLRKVGITVPENFDS